MKIKLYVVALLISLTSTAFAQLFPINPIVTVLPGLVTAQIYNPYYEPIICNGQVFGQTVRGPIYNAFFVEQFMVGGSYRYAEVVTNGFNPFIGGNANVTCRFARW